LGLAFIEIRHPFVSRNVPYRNSQVASAFCWALSAARCIFNERNETMSDSQFIEAFSEDPFVRDIHRRAMRILNDPTLDRNQRVFHIRKLQKILVEHQQKQAAKEKSPFKNTN
jgi:hypothetical protein